MAVRYGYALKHSLDQESDFPRFELIMREIQIHQPREEGKLVQSLIEAAFDEENCTIHSVMIMAKFLSVLTIRSKGAMEGLVKLVKNCCICYQNNTENLYSEIFDDELLTRRSVEKGWSHRMFGIYLNCCSECCVLLLLSEYLEKKYASSSPVGKTLEIPDWLIKEEKEVEEVMMMIELYSGHVAQNSVTKSINKKIPKRKTAKRKRIEEESE